MTSKTTEGLAGLKAQTERQIMEPQHQVAYILSLGECCSDVIPDVIL